MQRIDDNTFIDDTLVTCAEYQLFIDEMREQGKYHQPDHWTSYQFPMGEALEPILGIRHSDAVAFCEWLSSRERGEWKYRLPSLDEAEQYPIKQSSPLPLGYWATESSDEVEFIWVGPISVNPRNLDSAIAHDRDHYLSRTLDRAHTLDRDRAFDGTVNRARALDLDHTLELDRAFNRALAPGITPPLNLDCTLDRAHSLDRPLYLARDYALAIGSVFDFENQFLDIYIDLLTLQERIAGRSPAFEGIRLVKERIL